MRKKIERIESQTIISFTTADLEGQGWKVGDLLDLVDVWVVGPVNYPSADHENLIRKFEE